MAAEQATRRVASKPFHVMWGYSAVEQIASRLAPAIEMTVETNLKHYQSPICTGPSLSCWRKADDSR